MSCRLPCGLYGISSRILQKILVVSEMVIFRELTGAAAADRRVYRQKRHLQAVKRHGIVSFTDSV
jgi:hypothetical protein